MKIFRILNKKQNKNSFAILTDIQIICFINTNLFENFEKFLEDKLTEPKEKVLMLYLNNYWIKKRG